MKKLIGEVIIGAYFVGYWYYLLSSTYLALHKISWFGLGYWAVPQASISILWPLWLWLGYRPLMP
jgi:hypothetical protein